MNKILMTLLLCSLSGTLVQASASDDTPRTAQVGAYSAAPCDMPLVQEAKAFVQGRLPNMNLEAVLEAYIQVVAGMNVKLVCKVTEEEGPATWKFIAYRSLDRQWHLTLAEHL